VTKFLVLGLTPTEYFFGFFRCTFELPTGFSNVLISMLVKKKTSKFINLRIAGQKSILAIFQNFDQKFWKINFWKSGVFRFLGGFSNMPDSLSMKSDRSTLAQNRRFLYVHPIHDRETRAGKKLIIRLRRCRVVSVLLIQV